MRKTGLWYMFFYVEAYLFHDHILFMVRNLWYFLEQKIEWSPNTYSNMRTQNDNIFLILILLLSTLSLNLMQDWCFLNLKKSPFSHQRH